MATALRAGVVGTGFVGVVHVHALRLLGVEIAGVVGSSPERAAAKALAPVYASLEALLADDAVDVVHLTTPNHLHHPQTKQVLANLSAVLAAEGMTLADAVQVQVFLANLDDFATMNEIYGEAFKAPYPARFTVQAARLPRDARIEIGLIAVKRK